MEPIEDIPRLYPAPFWAAYGALEGGGIDSAILRQDIAEMIVAALIVYEIVAGKSGAWSRIDNAVIPGVVNALVAAHGQVWILRPAVYAAARVLTVG